MNDFSTFPQEHRSDKTDVEQESFLGRERVCGSKI